MTRLTTTALALILATGPALAASHTEGDSDGNMENQESMQSEDMQDEQAMADEDMSEDADVDVDVTIAEASEAMVNANPQLIRTRDITGGDIYTLAEEDMGMNWEDGLTYNAVEDGWTDIGEIEDVVLDQNGKIAGVVAEVGGIWDLGDKHVMLPIDGLKLVPVDDTEYSVVTRASLDDLQALEDLDEGFWN